ncbi:hypothetical protein [Undibacterium flavidum]|uniref:Uncharacterized protein n=1 Tax=Undibacterium flavidum TaxID=2762297 RepID=A0ABR6YBV6_9BURK|nr:hypothetical protein [Undibacterium flavidum]MBC3874064.1 hypothetical protein [Undibacterium flavidum]
MSRLSKFFIVVAVLFGMIVVSIFFNENEKLVPIQATPTSTVSQAEATTSTSNAGDTGHTTMPTRSELSTDQITREFYATKNMRIFMENAVKRPEEGGISMALQGMLQCRHRMALPKEIPFKAGMDSQVYAKRVNALRLTEHICQGLQEEDVSPQKEEQLRNLAEKQGDIRSNLWGDLSSALLARKIQAIPPVVEKFLSIKDPYLIKSWTQEIMLSQSGKAKVYWFDGEELHGEQKQDMRNAISLAHCSFGDPCNQNDLAVAVNCADTGFCYDHLTEYVRDVTYKNNPQGYARMLEYRQRLVDAIKREDIDAFIKKP